MLVSFASSVPKLPDYRDDNEDSFIIRDDSQCFALSDGAGESFDSKTWAQILTKKFWDDPCVTPEWTDKCVSRYHSAFDLGSLSFSQQAAFERGSFATLLGVQWDASDSALRIVAVGDSLALLVVGGVIINSWPYSTAAQFNNRPTLISTISSFNQFISDSDFQAQHYTSWKVENPGDTVLLCMTDALGQWLLRMAEQHDDSWKRLLAVTFPDELVVLIMEERAAKRMRVDDSTLVVARFHDGGPS
jgi:hypothetical protein